MIALHQIILRAKQEINQLTIPEFLFSEQSKEKKSIEDKVLERSRRTDPNPNPTNTKRPS